MNSTTLRIVLAAVLALAAMATFAASPPGPPSVLQTPEADRRGEDQTYLTFPEWFLVFSPAEYAELLRTRPSSEFPWFGHIGEFWRSYGAVIDGTRDYPFNGEYHTMIGVIGVSTSVEYGLKGSYEILVGRLTELTCEHNATAEDRLAAKVAQDYVDFIRVRPWYEFDFVSPLRALWRETPAIGDGMLRKWERRYLLTSEWGAKAAYAWLLGGATQSTFETPRVTTLAWVRNAPPVGSLAAHSITLVEERDDHSLLALPRYQGFTEASVWLASQGTEFIEIAGNRDAILVSLVTSAAEPMPQGAAALRRQALSTRPAMERRVLRTSVGGLAGVLRVAVQQHDEIEHVFDY